MRMKFFFITMVLVVTSGFLNSCSKSESSLPTITFTQSEGIANSQGEYTMRGHIHSDIRLDKVIITKQGAAAPFIIDDSTAKNKTEYDFTYLITGITVNTFMIVDIYNQDNGKKTVQFLIHPAP